MFNSLSKINPSLSKITVLVVDDQPSILDLIFTTLHTLGVGKVLEANSAEAARDLIELEKASDISGTVVIDSVMLDIVLGDNGDEGFQLAEWLRESSNSPNCFVPIMMFSALASLSMVQRSRDLGVNVFMRKPFAVNGLASLLLGMIKDQRNFIETEEFFGPDRCRNQAQDQAQDHAQDHAPGQERRKDQSMAKVFKVDNSKKVSYTLPKELVNLAEKEFKRKTGAALVGLDQQISRIIVINNQLVEASRQAGGDAELVRKIESSHSSAVQRYS